LQDVSLGCLFQPGRGRLHKFSVLAEQNGVDDELMVENPHRHGPQIGLPVVARQIDRRPIKEVPVKIKRRKFHVDYFIQ